MPRTHSEFVCRECGYRSPRPLGRCPECEAWGSLAELATSAAPAARLAPLVGAPAVRPVSLADIPHADYTRLPVAMAEFERVLGGGIVPGSLVLVGGDPGVGKSTLLTQLAAQLAADTGDVLYVSGEESLAQVGLRVRRLGAEPARLLFLSEPNVETVVSTVRATAPCLLVVDSIQSLFAPDLEALPGSVAQLRECTQRLMLLAKSSGVPIMLIGHVTKDGAIAGPKVLEHMVDTVLYLEGERMLQYRLLRSVKNRFGPTNEVGVFEMRERGLTEVANPSAVFLAERAEAAPGSLVTVALEGSRPILVEVQALASRSSLAIPRRTANGFDANRLHLLSAVLSRRLGLPLHDQDVYLNVVGGLRIDEPAADLAAALAMISSLRDRTLPADLVAVGEVGLSGEVRGVAQLELRLREAAKLGFAQAVVPRTSTLPAVHGMALLPAATLRDAARALHL